MLIAIVLDKPLSEAQALVDDPDAFMLEITNHSKQNAPCYRTNAPPWCAWRPALQNVPLPHQKAKSVALQRRIARSLKRNFNKCCICSAVNVGYHGWWSNIPPEPTLHVPSCNCPTDQHGIPMAGLHAPGLHCIQCKLAVTFITS